MMGILRPGAEVMRLPAPALSRKWFARWLHERVGCKPFGFLLNELFPEVYAALDDHSPLGCYDALTTYVNNELFPLCEYEVLCAIEGYWDEPQDYEERVCQLEGSGIPVQCFGTELDREGPDCICSPAVAAVACVPIAVDGWVRGNYDPSQFTCLQGCLDDVAELAEPQEAVDPYGLGLEGMEFVEPWNGLADLFRYTHGVTGNMMLDYCDMDRIEAGGPEWNLGDIQGFAREWRDASEILARAEALRDYVDARPEERAPVLVRALLGDERTLRELTR